VGEDTNQIEREIRERRAGLGRNLDELQDKARDLADWRTHYRGHTNTFLGAAFGAGLLIGLAALRTERRVNWLTDRDRETSPEPEYLRPRRLTQGQGTVARAARQLGETWDQIADGLVRTAGAKALQVVADMVPGFSDQFEPNTPPYVNGRGPH